MLRHGSLFSGIGGFDLAAEWMGWENIFHCEYDPFCQKILKHHFPNSKLYEDIKTFKATKYRGRIDILTGDSLANHSQTQGLDEERKTNATYGAKCLESFGKFPRATLWAKTFAAYLIGQGEFSSSRCALTWKLKATKLHRIYFQLVVKTLPTEGIEYGLLPTVTTDCVSNRTKNYAQGGTPLTVAVNGLLPTPTSQARERTLEECQDRQKKYGGEKESFVSRPLCSDGDAPDTISESNDWENFPTQPPLCGGDDGLPKELDGITFPKWRKESIKAYGNAIVPQVAHEIFKAIEKMEDTFVP